MFRKVCLIASCLLASATLFAQSYPAAEGSRTSLWVGAEISTFNPDYGCNSSNPFTCGDRQLIGIAPYVSANHLVYNRIGAEAVGRFNHWRGPGNLSESGFFVGPRVAIVHYKRVFFSGKILLGDAHLSLPKGVQGTGNYFAYAPGAIVDYKLTQRVFARVDYEYQVWPNFKGSSPSTTGGGGLSPNGFSFGVSYALTR